MTWLRAQENERADPLFHDPYAETFLAEAKEVVVRQTIAAGRVLAGRDAVPGCKRMVLAVDLREDWGRRLREAGFDPSAPTAWLIEGLLIYLTADEAAGPTPTRPASAFSQRSRKARRQAPRRLNGRAGSCRRHRDARGHSGCGDAG